ncbi:MAG: gliding motility-associatede transport system auxiliary component [Actinomycetota bacterium]|nr:gliding motility-associatede transport system auxiliary component [Actinomycetota bacterium]MDQ1501691.1 gliding motility-associatede transport system auxiliary component [Actinomycetota bacterium]
MIVFRRELRTLVTSPQAWAIATAYLIISGLFFVTLLFSHPYADLERYYSNIETTLIVVAPILAMRSFAEERRTGALDITLSWPVSRWTLVAGKWAANTVFLWGVVSIAWLYMALLHTLGRVELGNAAAGWMGLLVLVAMFNAVALAVSARSTSPTSAAFVGFGVLLGLWILDFVPGWLGGRFNGIVSFLAPTNHIENSGRGILDAGDGLYFLMGVLFGLTLAGAALREPGRRTLRRLVDPRRAGVVLGLFLVVGSGVASAQARGQVDLTPEHRFSLTTQSKAVLGQVKAPIHVIGFTQPGSAQQVEMRSLLRRYQLVKGDLSFEFIDPDAQPGRVKELGAGSYGEILLQVGKNRDFVSEISEVDLTSAIQRLARTEPPTACFTVGHGERDIDDQRPDGYQNFATRLKHLGYVTQPLALAAEGGAARLATCQVVILAGPRAGFLPSELAMLQDFAKAQGRLVVLADSSVLASAPEVIGQLDDLIRPWGLGLRPSVIRDRSSLINDPASVLVFKYPSQSPVTVDLKARTIPTLLVGALPVESIGVGPEKADGAWLTPLLQTSSQSSLADGTKGPFVAGALTDWSRVDQSKPGGSGVSPGGAAPVLSRTRIGVVGSADLASNTFLGRFGNSTFAGQLVSWVAIENDIIAASRDPGGPAKLALTQTDRGRLVRRAIVAPGGLTSVAFALALLRLRRR